MSFPFVKGHGTHNDFVVLPDPDGTVHGDLAPERVAALCDRRAGIGADGVLRVVRTSAVGDLAAADGTTEWFMDYRNADGSPAQMCGNGLRVFARYLDSAGLVGGNGSERPLRIGTRDGVKEVTFCADGELSVDMGVPKAGSSTPVSVAGRAFSARHVDMGNPHAVVFVDDLADAGDLGWSPYFCGVEFPEGLNVEFAVRSDKSPGAAVEPAAGGGTGERGRLRMRVYERGVGETMSCGTGACAVAVAAACESDGGPRLPASYTIDVPGGRLHVRWDADSRVHLKGPAVLVASGTYHPTA